MARRNKRNISDEILEGLQAIRDQYAGKITLRTYKIEESPLPEVDAHLIRDLANGWESRDACSLVSYGLTNARWKNGNKGGRDRTNKPPPLFC